MIKHVLVLDFETLWTQDYSLSKMSTPEYIFHEKFEVLLLAVYDLTRKPGWMPASHIPNFLARYPADETMVVAHNALFDGSILAWKYNYIPALTIDTLGLVRTLRRFKRNSLAAVAKELKLGQEKDEHILKDTQGCNVAGIKAKGLWPKFCNYAIGDVELCAKILLTLWKEFPLEERQVMNLVLRSAFEPVLRADVPLLQEHLIDLRQRKTKLLSASGYDKAQLMSTRMFQDALEGLGVEVKTKISLTGRIVPAFAKTDQFMQDLLEYHGSYDDDTNFKVQALATARLAHKSTIEETRTEKFIKIASLPWADGTVLPVPLRYGGAHTHRLSGEWGMNLQNLPRDKSKSKLRTAIVAPDDHVLVTGDLSQIEARLVAVLCGEMALVRAFREGVDVYAEFASTVFNRKIDKDKFPAERFIGKTAILGLGYGCGATRFYLMVVAQARQYGIALDALRFTPDVAQRIVDTYRNLFNRIPAFWKSLDRLLQTTILNDFKPGFSTVGPVKCMARRIELPNGLLLNYDNIGPDEIWGGKLLENICQALARVIIMQAALRLNDLGYRFVLQAHDELLFVIYKSDVRVAKEIILRELTRPPAWLPGLPLAAEVGSGANYGVVK